MKPKLPLLSAVVVILGAFSLLGCKPAAQEEDAKISTEVAVQVAKIARMTLHSHVEAYGTVEPEPAGEGRPAGAARLAAPSAGIVMSVPVKEGESVQAGTIVAKLDDQAALAQLQFAQEQMARQNKMKADGGTSEKAIQEAAQQLATAKAELALVQLTSPLSGVVSRIDVQPGQAVDLNTIVAEIVDPNRLVLTTGIPTAEASALKAGQTAEIFLGSNDKPDATGTISFVSPTVDSKTGTVLVRVTLPKDSGLRSGQFARVRLVNDERPDRLAVPVESVVTDVDGHSTIALVDGDKATQKSAKVGVRDGDWVEVEGNGFKEGDVVVTVGAYGLPQETKVRVIKP